MHVGKYRERYKCQPISLDSWKSEEIEDKTSGMINFQEKYIGKTQIKEVTQEKYLGNKINSDGTNMVDIEAKCNRGVGTINKIQTILETMYFGECNFQVGKTMIGSMLQGEY